MAMDPKYIYLQHRLLLWLLLLSIIIVLQFHDLLTRHTGFSGHRLGQKRLARPGRSTEKRALGNFGPQFGEPEGIFQKVDKLHDFDLGLLASGHVAKVHLDVGRFDFLGVGPANAKNSARTGSSAAHASSGQHTAGAKVERGEECETGHQLETFQCPIGVGFVRDLDPFLGMPLVLGLGQFFLERFDAANVKVIKGWTAGAVRGKNGGVESGRSGKVGVVMVIGSGSVFVWWLFMIMILRHVHHGMIIPRRSLRMQPHLDDLFVNDLKGLDVSLGQ